MASKVPRGPASERIPLEHQLAAQHAGYADWLDPNSTNVQGSGVVTKVVTSPFVPAPEQTKPSAVETPVYRGRPHPQPICQFLEERTISG